MTPQFFDAHTHLNMLDLELPQLKGTLPPWQEVGEQTLANSIWFINIGADSKSSEEALSQARHFSSGGKFSGVGATAGIHPTENWQEKDLETIARLAKEELVLAIGECGLEYFHISDETARQRQCELFNRQIEIALAVGKPLMIHCRPSVEDTADAYDDLYEILASYREIVEGKIRFNLHFFAGDWAIAEKFLKLGAYLSFPGVITFSSQFDEIIKRMPLERLMSETDAPFATPVPHRGERNQPAYVVCIVDRLVALRPESEDEVRLALVNNAKTFFNL